MTDSAQQQPIKEHRSKVKFDRDVVKKQRAFQKNSRRSRNRMAQKSNKPSGCVQLRAVQDDATHLMSPELVPAVPVCMRSQSVGSKEVKKGLRFLPKIQVVQKLMRPASSASGSDSGSERDFEAISLGCLVNETDKPPRFNFSDSRAWPEVSPTEMALLSKRLLVAQGEKAPQRKSWFQHLRPSFTKARAENAESVQVRGTNFIREEKIENEWNLVTQKPLYKDILSKPVDASPELDERSTDEAERMEPHPSPKSGVLNAFYLGF